MAQLTLSLLGRVKTKASLRTLGILSKLHLLTQLTLIRRFSLTQSSKKECISFNKHSRLIIRTLKIFNRQFRKKKGISHFQMTVPIIELEVMGVRDRSLPTVVDLNKITYREMRVRMRMSKIMGRKRTTDIACREVL
jgi:hypothetical protein